MITGEQRFHWQSSAKIYAKSVSLYDTQSLLIFLLEGARESAYLRQVNFYMRLLA